MKLESYDVVSRYLQSRDRAIHLLLGNGFSMAYDRSIFSYNALHGFIERTGDELLSKLFDIVKTKNFELVMQQLDNFAELLDLFGSDDVLKANVQEASGSLRHRLIEAIKSLHPEHVFTIPEEKSAACARFVRTYLDLGGSVFTTNYDVLLYWVLMRNSIPNAVDGFGRDRENPDEYVPEEQLSYSELRWGRNQATQTVHYLHGALPLFDTGTEIVKEQYDDGAYLLERVEDRLKNGQYPVFVAAGNGVEKLTHIRHNRYLTNCYDALSRVTGSLVTFGFNFGEYDEHIINAINVAAKHGKKAPKRLWSIYIGVYSDDDREHIESIEDRFKCKVHMYDAKTANVWGG